MRFLSAIAFFTISVSLCGCMSLQSLQPAQLPPPVLNMQTVVDHSLITDDEALVPPAAYLIPGKSIFIMQKAGGGMGALGALLGPLGTLAAIQANKTQSQASVSEAKRNNIINLDFSDLVPPELQPAGGVTSMSRNALKIKPYLYFVNFGEKNGVLGHVNFVVSTTVAGQKNPWVGQYSLMLKEKIPTETLFGDASAHAVQETKAKIIAAYSELWSEFQRDLKGEGEKNRKLINLFVNDLSQPNAGEFEYNAAGHLVVKSCQAALNRCFSTIYQSAAQYTINDVQPRAAQK